MWNWLLPRVLRTGRLVAFLAAIPCLANGAPQNTGRWTSSPHWDWQNIPIHLMLLPAGSGTYHSRVLWWEDGHHGTTTHHGGLWGWTRAETLNCQQSASTGFTSLTYGHPGVNIFCAGNTAMMDGRAFIAGGTEEGEVGLLSALIYDPDASPQWSATPPDMELRRWYPTITRQPDGKLTVSSGSEFAHLHVLGGRAMNSPSTVATRGLRRLGLNSAGTWVGTKYELPPEAPSFRDWPERISGHTFGPRELSEDLGPIWASQVVVDVTFGGDTLTNGSWISTSKLREFKRYDRRLLADYDYPFINPPPTVNPQVSSKLPRGLHVMISDNHGANPGMIVFGGRRRSSSEPDSALNDVWHYFWDPNLQPFPNWRWVRRLIGTEANAPSRRFGHAAIYDPIWKRMLVWGGTPDSASSSGLDGDLYALNLRDPSAPYWYKPSNIQGTAPASRFGHRMLFDNIKRYRGGSTWQYRALMFGGKTGGGLTGLKNDLWSLWIDPADSTHLEWVQVSAASTGRPNPRAWPVVALDGYRLLVFGGDIDSANADRRFFEIDLPHTGDIPHNADTQPFAWGPLTAQADSSWSGAAGIVSFTPSFARVSDLYDADGQSRTALTSSPMLEAWYPQHFVHTDGSLIATGPRDTSSRLPAGGGPWECYPASACTTNMGSYGSGAAVMWEPGDLRQS